MTTEAAPAKINLALHVRRRRADGYHDLETLFAFCTDGDMVRVEPAEEDSFVVTGPFAAALGYPHSSALPLSDESGHDNLVTRAARGFTARFGITQPHAITLDKHLPIASGIGGGSADAAATLRALARLHGVSSDDPALATIAATLGADVPACLLGCSALGTGRGDDLRSLPALGGVPVLLVNPRVAVSTAQVFARWDGVDRGGIAVEGSAIDRAKAGRNDLGPPARDLAPVIGEVLSRLVAMQGATLVRMSGSGATCFALFDTPAARDEAREELAGSGWWMLATALR